VAVGVPAVAGWFSTGEDGEPPALVGSRCTTCSTVFFPPATSDTTWCRNPDCDGTDLVATPLSRRGRIWSYTNACYQPPAPYVATTDPFEPFCLAAVELADEQLVVLGQLVSGVRVEDLRIGQEVELAVEPLFDDQLVWKWRPVAGPS
jgi:uncharacterized OB-fold protein